MEKSNGFTLVELLAVVLVMGILITLIAPSVYTRIKNTKDNYYVTLIDTIEDNTMLFFSRHKEEIETLVGDSGYYEISLQQLVDEELLKAPVIDPRDDSVISLSKKVYIKKFDQTFNACYDPSECSIGGDSIPPVITVLGFNPVNIDQGDTYVDAGATATDDVDGDITADIDILNNVNVNVPGQYTVTYNVSDAAGNAALEKTRTVNVDADAIPPVITMLGSSPVTINVGDTYVDAGATASDNLDGDITVDIDITTNLNVNIAGTYYVCYNVEDSVGNAATEVIRTIQVEEVATYIADGLILHLDADSITGLSDGNPVTQWDDTSGNNNHFTQSNVSYQPVYVASGLNGKPVVNFTTDYLTLGSNTMSGITFYSDPSENFTIFIIGRFTGDSVAFISKSGGTGSSATYVLYYASSQFRHVLRGITNSSAGDSNWTIHSMKWDGTNHFYRTDGGSDRNHNNIGTVSNQTNNIVIGATKAGSNNRLIGDIAEVLVYNRSLTATEMDQVEQYLGEKWLNW